MSQLMMNKISNKYMKVRRLEKRKRDKVHRELKSDIR
jgi:hypothetical protein